MNPNGFLRGWPTAAPLDRLAVCPHGAFASGVCQQIDGPHLRGLSALDLHNHWLDAVLLLSSLNLDRLTELTISIGDDPGASRLLVEAVVASQRAAQLRRLSLPIWTREAAEVIASASSLYGLTALTADLHLGEIARGDVARHFVMLDLLRRRDQRKIGSGFIFLLPFGHDLVALFDDAHHALAGLGARLNVQQRKELVEPLDLRFGLLQMHLEQLLQAGNGPPSPFWEAP